VGTLTATGDAEIAAAGRASANIGTDSRVVSRGGFTGNTSKITEQPAAGHRPVHLIDDTRADQNGPR
jgi:hypothetical protein